MFAVRDAKLYNTDILFIFDAQMIKDKTIKMNETIKMMATLNILDTKLDWTKKAV